jgi:preprotein translocase subunit SecD
MGNRQVLWLIIAIVITIGIGVNLPGQTSFMGIDTHIREGLDLKGGIQVLLEADTPSGQDPTADNLNMASTIIKQRVDALGVSEPIVQVSPPRRIVVELPGYDNPDAAISLIKNTALLEFVDVPIFLQPGAILQTDINSGLSTPPTGANAAIATTGAQSINPDSTAPSAQPPLLVSRQPVWQKN